MKFICIQFSLAIKIVPLKTIKKRKRERERERDERGEVRCWMLRWKQLWWWGWWRYCDCVCAHVCACVFVRVCMRHTCVYETHLKSRANQNLHIISGEKNNLTDYKLILDKVSNALSENTINFHKPYFDRYDYEKNFTAVIDLCIQI